MTLTEKVRCVVDFVWGGEHHLRRLVEKNAGFFWQAVPFGSLATFDDSKLTRLVLACHVYCVRAEIEGNGPRGIRVLFHNRKGRVGSMYERHPTIAEALAAAGVGIEYDLADGIPIEEAAR